MKTYNVKWEISIEATNKKQAAKKALEILLNLPNQENIATIFNVNGKEIDLLEYKNKLLAVRKSLYK